MSLLVAKSPRKQRKRHKNVSKESFECLRCGISLTTGVLMLYGNERASRLWVDSHCVLFFYYNGGRKRMVTNQPLYE